MLYMRMTEAWGCNLLFPRTGIAQERTLKVALLRHANIGDIGVPMRDIVPLLFLVCRSHRHPCFIAVVHLLFSFCCRSSFVL